MFNKKSDNISLAVLLSYLALIVAGLVDWIFNGKGPATNSMKQIASYFRRSHKLEDFEVIPVGVTTLA